VKPGTDARSPDEDIPRWDRRTARPKRLPPVPPPGGALLLRADGRSASEVLAGITLVALSLPMNIGYAAVAGLPATAGVYASIVPVLVFAVTTGSRRLVFGPDATIAALLGAVLLPVSAMGADPVTAALGVALLTGLLLLVAWLLRLGGLARFLSHAVLVGFIAGLAVEILTSQVRKMLAVEVDAEGWLREVVGIVGALPRASAASVAVGAGTIVIVRLLRRAAPRAPGSLLALVVVGGLVAWFVPDDVAVLGPVPAGFPAPTFPSLTLAVWLELLPVALAIAALVIAEGVLISQKEGRRHGEEIAPNDEVFAYGMSNVAAAVFGGMPVGASASRTAALGTAGARSQVPGLVAAVTAALVAMFATGLLAAIPSAALAGLVANAVVTLLDLPTFRHLARVRRSEFVIAVGCAVAVLLLGPLPGLVVAALATAIDVVRRAAAMPWVELTAGPVAPDGRYATGPGHASGAPGLRLLRPEGPLFFANADVVRTTLRTAAADPHLRWLVLDLEAVADIDPTAAEALADGIAAAHAAGIVVAFSRVRGPISDLLARYGLTDAVGMERIFATNRAAADAYEGLP
jgi:sulfate permease, SulP family